MEASPSRNDDSFSRGGWPARCNKLRSFERLDVDAAAAALGESFSSSTASFIDMDPEPEELFSMRWTTTSEEDGLLHFGLPRTAGAAACSSSPLLLASADAGGLVAFSDDSLLLPCARDVIGGSYADASACSSPAAFHTARSTPASVIISSASRRSPGSGASKPLLATRRILLRYLRFLVPLCRKARALRLPVPRQVPARVFSASRSSRAVATTPARRSTSSAAAEYWCHGNADVAVHDAILHCKKSLLTASTEC